jgi:tetratricopeptide (TPR) repeat protein
VSLFLVGLSLTVVGSFRRYLIVPGILIAAWCVVWTGLIARAPLRDTSDRAIKMVAEGHRLEARALTADTDDAVRKGLKDAIAQYDQAIADSPYFGPAYSSRADAVFKLGSPQDLGGGGFQSLTDDKSLKQSLADDQKALRFDNPDEIEILDNLSFNSMLANRLGDAERLAKDVIKRNDQISRVWLNLGVIEVARGDESAAQDAYDRGLDLLRKEPDPIIRAQLYAGARTDLEEAIFLNDDRTDLAEKFESQITGSEIGQAAKDAPAAPNAKAGEIEFTPDGSKIHAEFDYSGIPSGAGVGFVWYYHQSDASPFLSQQAARFDGDEGMSRALPFDGDDSGRYFVEGQIGSCPRPGEYRLDVYVGDTLVTTGVTTIEAGPLGKPVAESSDLMSASLCRPADWQDDRSDPDVVTFLSPDKSATFSVGSYLLNEADLPDDKVQAEDDFIRGFFGTDVPSISNFHLSGVAGRRGLVQKGGRSVNVVVFIGEDNSVHFIGAAATTPQQFDVLDEMLATLQFHDLPSHAVDPRVDEISLHGDV